MQKGKAQGDSMEFDKVELKNFLVELKNLNNLVPIQILEVLGKNEFTIEDAIKEFYRFGADFIDFVFIGVKSFEKFQLEIYVRLKRDEFEKCSLQFLFLDVTMSRQLEEAKYKKHFKSIFLSKIAHEFKNPLISIKELINQIPLILDPKDKEKIELTKDLLDFMLMLVSDFSLVSSEVQINKALVNRTDVYLDSFSKFCISITKHMYIKDHGENGRNVDELIFSEIDRTLPEVIKTDEIKLKQIIMNLLSNSLKFSKNGFIKLKIKKARMENKDFAKFSVIDSGCGIDPEVSGHLFEEFSKTTKNNNAFGCGLGLSIVKELTSLLGVQIRYKRNAAKGLSKFFFYLPIEVCEERLAESRSMSAGGFSESYFSTSVLGNSRETLRKDDGFFISPRLKSLEQGLSSPKQAPSTAKRIIVVDDEKLVRGSQVRMLKAFFEKAGREVEILEADDGLEALHLIYQSLNAGKVIECIMMDETMKYLCGSLCASFIKNLVELQLVPAIPVFLVTAYLDKFTDEDIHAKGIAKVFSKPLTNCVLSEIFV
jgi:signal transduction histidine kinase